MKKFYQYSEVNSALKELADKDGGPLPDQSHPRYEGLSKCWAWNGPLNNCGYATIPVVGRSLLAHRAMYIYHYGDIPYKKCVLHQCDNRSCTNPDHLHLGTHADNMREAAERRSGIKGVALKSKQAKKEYMKEYMRKRRAMAKLNTNPAQ